MANGINVTVVGVEDIQKALKKFGIKAEGQQAAVIKETGEIIRKAISDRAPVDSGALRDSIILAESEDNTKGGPFAVEVGPSFDPAFYAHFVEFGTARHPISRGTKNLKTGADDYAASVNHPGANARPFIRPALDENIDKAIKTAASEFKKKLDL